MLVGILPFVGCLDDLSFVSESREAAETDGNRYQKQYMSRIFVDGKKDDSWAKQYHTIQNNIGGRQSLKVEFISEQNKVHPVLRVFWGRTQNIWKKLISSKMRKFKFGPVLPDILERHTSFR